MANGRRNKMIFSAIYRPYCPINTKFRKTTQNYTQT